MGKRKYTHVKELLPAIQAMVEAGMTQREIAEHYGFDSKLVVKKLLERSRQKEKQCQTPEEESQLRHCRNISMRINV